MIVCVSKDHITITTMDSGAIIIITDNSIGNVEVGILVVLVVQVVQVVQAVQAVVVQAAAAQVVAAQVHN